LLLRSLLHSELWKKLFGALRPFKVIELRSSKLEPTERPYVISY